MESLSGGCREVVTEAQQTQLLPYSEVEWTMVSWRWVALSVHRCLTTFPRLSQVLRSGHVRVRPQAELLLRGDDGVLARLPAQGRVRRLARGHRLRR